MHESHVVAAEQVIHSGKQGAQYLLLALTMIRKNPLLQLEQAVDERGREHVEQEGSQSGLQIFTSDPEGGIRGYIE